MVLPSNPRALCPDVLGACLSRLAEPNEGGGAGSSGAAWPQYPSTASYPAGTEVCCRQRCARSRRADDLSATERIRPRMPYRHRERMSQSYGFSSRSWPRRRVWPSWVLAAIDHYSRKVVTLCTLEGPNAGWVIEALEDAFRRQGASRHLIADQESVFACSAFRDLREQWQVKQPFGAVGKHGSMAAKTRRSMRLGRLPPGRGPRPRRTTETSTVTDRTL
jgi:hypothetical protein